MCGGCGRERSGRRGCTYRGNRDKKTVQIERKKDGYTHDKRHRDRERHIPIGLVATGHEAPVTFKVKLLFQTNDLQNAVDSSSCDAAQPQQKHVCTHACMRALAIYAAAA